MTLMTPRLAVRRSSKGANEHESPMKDYPSENLSHDPLHGYIPFTSGVGMPEEEVSERQIIDHPWLQRLRQIHQLQTAWWVYPTAEHTRFQHVLGVMHMASRAVDQLYESLAEQCDAVPSRGYVECLLRMAGLLHDVGHGPFGHFFDAKFLSRYGLTHETLGSQIVEQELGDLLRGIRRNPNSVMESGESLDPAQIAFLITRPTENDEIEQPRWLVFLRSLFCGIYTIDNMDFVLRDAYMTGYSACSFDLERLLHYTFFSDRGLTIHDRAINALIRFMGVRADLFRSVYFHRTVRAIDLTLADLFDESADLLFDGSPREHLDGYQRFTEWSLLGDVAQWHESDDPRRRELAPKWRQLLDRQIPWKMVCQRHKVFAADDAEQSSIFSYEGAVESQIRDALSAEAAASPFRVDVARHIHRPHTLGPTAGMNFLYDSAQDQTRPLTDDQLFRQLPTSARIVRIYAHDDRYVGELTAALDKLLGPVSTDDVTNM